MVMVLPAKKKDFDFFYDVKCENDNIFWSGYDKAPDYNNLKQVFYKWIDEMPMSDKRRVCIIYNNGLRQGYIYIDPMGTNEVEFALGVSEKYSGHGIGTEACAQIIDMMRSENKHIVNAYIREDNHRSIRLFVKNGFVEDKHGAIHRNLENLGKETKMLKFMYDLR